jgi:ribosomal protein S18 acetylase RimI-like enzyme
MLSLATHARARNLKVLVLDTRSGDPSQKLYESLGYRVVGEIPDYALGVGGRLISTTVMYFLL